MDLPESAREFLARLESQVRELQPRRRIAFSEGNDPRVVAAAERLARAGLADPVLVTNPNSSPDLARYARLYYQRRQGRGVTERQAQQTAARPLYFAALMVAAGDAHGTVGGAANSTAETVRAALHCIGPAPGIRSVSSFFVMALRDRTRGAGGLLVAADCAVIVSPAAAELDDIERAAAASARTFLRCEPVIARLGGDENPDLERANALIFPNLNAANIGYKLMEWMGGAAAFGPMLQGLAKPANDLSRAATVDDIYSVALVTALQSS